MKEHNMRRADVRRKEIYFMFSPEDTTYGWWAHDAIADKDYIEFEHKGFRLRWPIRPTVLLHLESPDQIIRTKAATQVASVVQQFRDRVNDTLRGGYC